MSKSNSKEAPEATAVAKQAAPVTLTLTEFCTRLSVPVRRPALIGAFEAVERQAGRTKATEAEFRSRFDDFVKQPV